MCAVSGVIDEYRTPGVPSTFPYPFGPGIVTPDTPLTPQFLLNIKHLTQAEWDELKASIEDLKVKLEAALKIDREENRPDCGKKDKIDLIKRLAKEVGVDLKDIFPE